MLPNSHHCLQSGRRGGERGPRISMNISDYNISRRGVWGVGRGGCAHWPTNNKFDSCVSWPISVAVAIVVQHWLNEILWYCDNAAPSGSLYRGTKNRHSTKEDDVKYLHYSYIYLCRHLIIEPAARRFPCAVFENLHRFSFLSFPFLTHTLHCQLILTLNVVPETGGNIIKKQTVRLGDNVIRLIKTDSWKRYTR